MALKSDGTVKAGDDNDQQAVGIGKDDRLFASPQDVIGLANVRRVAADVSSSAALDKTGNLWVWGANGRGQLGNGHQDIRGTPPRAGDDTYCAVGAGMLYSLALRADGLAWSFGLNFSGQLGDGGYAHQNSPVGVVEAADKIPPLSSLHSVCWVRHHGA